MIKSINSSTTKKLGVISGTELLTLYMPLAKGLQGHKQNQSQLHAFRAQLKNNVSRELHEKYTVMLERVNDSIAFTRYSDGLAIYSDGANLCRAKNNSLR